SVVNLLASIWRQTNVGRVGTFIARPHGNWPFPEICTIDGESLTLYDSRSAYERLRAHGARVAVIEGCGLGTEACDATGLTPLCDRDTLLATAIGPAARGVLRRRGPTVIGRVPADCVPILEDAAREREARLVWAHEGVEAHVTTFADGRPTIDVRTPPGR